MSGERKIMNGLIIAGLILVLAFVSVGCAVETRTVCSSGSCAYTSIQAAINASESGDIIEVHSGTYYENVNVNKQLVLRGVDTGTGKPVVDACRNGSAITLNANGITVDGFTATNARGNLLGGIKVYSHNNTVINNTASNSNYGIFLWFSNNNILTGNTALSNVYSGIYLHSSSYNTVSNNTASNTDDGFDLWSNSNNNNLKVNNASNNNYGIVLYFSSKNNMITGNTASNNAKCGIYLSYSSTNHIYNNYFDNTKNALDDGNNIWNITLTPGTNIINGSWLGGNYWSDYTGEDTNGDGLGDTLTPYNSSGDITNGGDWRPLVMAAETPYTNIDVGVTSNITIANSSDLVAYLPPEYDGMDISDAVVLTVNVTDTTPGNSTDNAYTDITINVGDMDVETCKVFKSGMGFLPEVPDVTTRPTVKPPGVPAFSRDVANNTVTVRLYVGDPLLAVLPSTEEPIFDTKEGTYPSVSGTFTGTITPSRNLTVSTLYTYYCKGTGGHTKLIALYDGTKPIASGLWSGYQGDWHNVTFTEVTLLKNHEYRYVIETGSYPQVVHAESKDVTGGVITCEEFIDLNGQRHEGWIPAIRLS